MTTEAKIIGGIFFATFVILIGGVFFLSNNEKKAAQGTVISQTGVHWHPKLSIYINGKKQDIPAGIGLGAAEMSMHTHDTDGVIHMELAGPVTANETKIGNFFNIWGKDFSSTKILDKEGKVSMIVNGRQNKEFENYEMQNGDDIVIRL